MPLQHPKRNNALMKSYLRALGYSSEAYAKRCGVSHSQTYMGRTRNVGPDNVAKIARKVALDLHLSVEQGLDLHERAEMGREALRRALYEKPGKGTAGKIATVLAEAAGLSDAEAEAVRAELLMGPKKVTEKSS